MGILGFLAGFLPVSDKPRDNHQEEPAEDPDKEYKEEPEPGRFPNYDLLHKVNYTKIDDMGPYEVGFGKAHTSPDHKSHKYGLTAPRQIDLQVRFKGHHGLIYHGGMEVTEDADEEPKQSKGRFKLFNVHPDDEESHPSVSFVSTQPEPFDLQKHMKEYMPALGKSSSSTGYTSPSSSSDDDEKPQRASSGRFVRYNACSEEEDTAPRASISRGKKTELTLPENDETTATPLYAQPFARPGCEYTPPEDNRTLQERIDQMVDPLARRCNAAVDRMARERHEDLLETIRTAPSGYVSSGPAPEGPGWNCTNGWGSCAPEKYNLEVPRVTSRGRRL